MTYPSNLNAIYKKTNNNIIKTDFYSKKHFVDIFHETFELFSYFNNIIRVNKLYKWLPINGVRMKRSSNNNIYIFCTLTNNLFNRTNLMYKLNKLLKDKRKKNILLEKNKASFLMFRSKNQMFLTLDYSENEKHRAKSFSFLYEVFKKKRQTFNPARICFILKKIKGFSNKNKYLIYINTKKIKHFSIGRQILKTNFIDCLKTLHTQINIPKNSLFEKKYNIRGRKKVKTRLLLKQLMNKKKFKQKNILTLPIFFDYDGKTINHTSYFTKPQNSVRNPHIKFRNFILINKFNKTSNKSLNLRSKRSAKLFQNSDNGSMPGFLVAKKKLFDFRYNFYTQIKNLLKEKLLTYKKKTRKGNLKLNFNEFITRCQKFIITHEDAKSLKLMENLNPRTVLFTLLKNASLRFNKRLYLAKYRRLSFKLNSKLKGRKIKNFLKYASYTKNMQYRFLLKQKILLNFLKAFTSENSFKITPLITNFKNLCFLNLTDIRNILQNILNVHFKQKATIALKTYKVSTVNLNKILLFDSRLINNYVHNKGSRIFYNKALNYKVLLDKKISVNTRMKLLNNELLQAFEIKNASITILYQNLFNIDEKIITSLKKVTQDKKQTLVTRLKMLLKESLITQNFDNFNILIKRILERKNTKKFRAFAQRLVETFKELFYEIFLINVFLIARQKEALEKSLTINSQISININNPQVFKMKFPTSVLFHYKGKLAKAGRKQKLSFFIKNPFVVEFLKLYDAAYLKSNNGTHNLTGLKIKPFLSKNDAKFEKLNTFIPLNLKKGGAAGLRFLVSYLSIS